MKPGEFEAGSRIAISDEALAEGEGGGSISRTTQLAVAQHYSGPLPSPKSLAEFEKACPGLADRITTMAEKDGEHRRQSQAKETEHRHAMESQEATHQRDVDLELLRTETRITSRGQVMGFSLILVVMVAGFVSLWLGFSGVGIGAVITALGGIVISWVSRHLETRRLERQMKKEREEQAAAKEVEEKAEAKKLEKPARKQGEKTGHAELPQADRPRLPSETKGGKTPPAPRAKKK